MIGPRMETVIEVDGTQYKYYFESGWEIQMFNNQTLLRSTPYTPYENCRAFCLDDVAENKGMHADEVIE